MGSGAWEMCGRCARALGCGGLLEGEEAGGRGLGVHAAVYLLLESMLPPLSVGREAGAVSE